MKCVTPGHESTSPGGGGTPAVAVPLGRPGDPECYYLLGEFNHHHHHAVLAGDAPRYSSTHRVGVTATDTWQYIWSRVEGTMDAVADPPKFSRDGGATSPLLASAIRSIEELHSELEFEWLRPWGVQGKLHAETHASYWAPRIGKLHAVWLRLEARTAAHLAFLAAAAADGVDNKKAAKALPEGVRCFDVLLSILNKRQGVASQSEQKGRAGWNARASSREYQGLPAGCRPFAYPIFEASRPAARHEPKLGAASVEMPPEELSSVIAELTRHRANFARNMAAGGGGGGGGGKGEQGGGGKKQKLRKGGE